MIRKAVGGVASRAAEVSPRRQAGAIPYTVVDGRAVFLLITTRRSGRWIFPKGEPIEGMQPWEVAVHEAFEEAGVEGETERTPIGCYRTLKSGIRPYYVEVDMYPLRLTRQADDWPDKDKRHRHWVIFPEARRLLSYPELVDMAAEIDRRHSVDQPANSRISA
jgi:8-oxo-dGTP pyrophosphatase MutT (NUDIX family)